MEQDRPIGIEDFAFHRPVWNQEADRSVCSNFLVTMAAADKELLAQVPPDERIQVRIAGLGQLSGTTFQFLTISAGMLLAFRPETLMGAGIVALSAVSATAVLYSYDQAMIASHYLAKGNAYCDANGIFRSYRSALLVSLAGWAALQSHFQ